MKKMTLNTLFLGLMVLMGSNAVAAPLAGSDFGIGFVLGNPSGLSAKLPTSQNNALQFILAFNNNRDNWNNHGWANGDCNTTNDCNGSLYFGGDYVWYNYNAIPVKQGRLPFYYGPGLWMSASDNSAVGMRFVLGLEYQFAAAPFDIFLEIAPGIRVIPNTDGYVSAGLGARFFF